MQLNYDSMLDLSRDDVEKILAEYCEQKLGVKPEEFRYSIVSEVCGMGSNTRVCNNFKGIVMTVNKLKPVPKSEGDKS